MLEKENKVRVGKAVLDALEESGSCSVVIVLDTATPVVTLSKNPDGTRKIDGIKLPDLSTISSDDQTIARVQQALLELTGLEEVIFNDIAQSFVLDVDKVLLEKITKIPGIHSIELNSQVSAL